jgi:ubiquinone/menaquinone biosynthesis C-methylase UbiE
MTDPLIAFYPESRFGEFSRFDGTIGFYARVNELANFDSVVLDIGCGRGVWLNDPVHIRRQLRDFKGRCARIIGADVDSSAAENPSLDEFRLLTGATWPFEDNSIDVCICDVTIEHVDNIDTFLREAARVVKPGGYMAIRTPNVFSYFGLASRLLPHRYHVRLAPRGSIAAEKDVFSTFYRCNNKWKLSRALKKAGFDAYVYNYEQEPRYPSFWMPTYALGVCTKGLHRGLCG